MDLFTFLVLIFDLAHGLYNNICLLTMCNSTAVDLLDLDRLHEWDNVLPTCRRRQLNADKTKLLWFCTASQLRQLSSDSLANGYHTKPKRHQAIFCRRRPGRLVWHWTIDAHVSRMAQTCFFHLRRLRSVRRQLDRDIIIRLVTALVLSRLDYCSAVLAGLLASTLAPIRRSTNRTRLQASWPRNSCFTLATIAEKRVHIVSGPQNVRRPRTRLLVDTSIWCPFAFILAFVK